MTNNTKKTLGITGGIGSGKSIVGKVLETMGYPVYNSDTRAKELINESPELRAELQLAFGESIYSPTGLDRKKMAGIVFNNTDKLSLLNSIVHPAVGNDFDSWRNNQSTNIVFKEAAILFETGIYKSLDGVILVTAPIQTRINRVIKRDQTTQTEVESRMKNQWSDEEKLKLSDYVIDNSGEIMVIPQVAKLLKTLGG